MIKQLILGIFLIIFLPFICKSQYIANSDLGIKKHILELELKGLKDMGQDSIYIQYGLNDLLKGFVEKNALNGNEKLEFHDFRRCFSSEEQKIVFNNGEAKHFYDQLNNLDDKIIFLIDLPKNKGFTYAPVNKVKNNFKMGVPLSTDIYTYIVSQPLVTTNKDYVLLGYSVGFSDSRTGGIKIYKKTDDDYKVICLLESWTE